MYKRVAAVIAVILVAVQVVGAQTLKVAGAGDKALLFNFSGLSTLNLGEYEGGLGGKYYISDGTAIRGMLLFGVDNKTTKGTAGFTDATDNTLSFGLSGALEYHLPLAASVSPYLGGGVMFTTTSETFTPSVFTGGTAVSTKTSQTAYGLGALAGVEYFFNQSISLSAEYQFGLTYRSQTNPDANELMVGFQTAGLTFAVYF